MIAYGNIHPDDYIYRLPPEKIASIPVEERDQSLLLIRNKNGTLCKDRFFNIASYLPENSYMFFNNSRVIPARFLFTKETGAIIEIFCIRPVQPLDYKTVMQANNACIWECVVGNLKKFTTLVISKKIQSKDLQFNLKAEKVKMTGQSVHIEFSWDDPEITFKEVLLYGGITPLPPYIKRKPVDDDQFRYQTIYAKNHGSVAAPTAGLHFTDNVFSALRSKNIHLHEVTLHVGAGTFQPIKVKRVADHKMHAEIVSVTLPLIIQLCSISDKVISVGTTTLRSLESIYWLGVKIITAKDKTNIDPVIMQWEAYKLPQHYSMLESFEALREWMHRNGETEFLLSTSLMVVPGYRFQTVDTLITNFHQPGSTLLLLIAALIGNDWKSTYQYALDNDFRFLSYGDSSLLFT